MNHYILHPDDFAQAFGEHKGPVTVEGDGGAQFERDQFGVTKPGEYIMIDNPDPPTAMRFLTPSTFRLEHPDLSDRELAFRYSMLAIRQPPRFIGVDLSSDEIAEYNACKRAYRKTWSLKRRAREQRRMDWASRVRRRKRRAELRARMQ